MVLELLFWLQLVLLCNEDHGVGHGVGHDVGHDVGRGVGQDAGHDVGHDVDHDVGHDAGHGVGHVVGHDVDHDVGHNELLHVFVCGVLYGVSHDGVDGVDHDGVDGVDQDVVDGEAYVEPYKVVLDGYDGGHEVVHEVQYGHVHVEAHDGVFHL